MMQHAPRVHHVEAAQPRKVSGIECRALRDAPLCVSRKVAPAQFPGAGDRLRIVIEGHDTRSQPARRQAEQTAAAADIEETLTGQVIDLQHLPQRIFRLADTVVVQDEKEALPVLSEGEAFTGGDLLLGSRGHQAHCNSGADQAMFSMLERPENGSTAWPARLRKSHLP